jgi:amidophosphoribosyltransferase
MSKMSEFIAFKAAVELLKDRHQESLITEVYDKCKTQVGLPKEQMVNYVKEIYSPFTDKDISRKMVEMLKAPEVKSDIEIVYQTIDGLHKACPKHTGDWYFSGDYPTPGGYNVLHKALENYLNHKTERSY